MLYRFGLGYKLTLVKAAETFDPVDIRKLVLLHVPRSETLSYAGGEMSFRLPREFSSKFPGLFRDLESKRQAMGIGGYGVSITSLEEVFLSLENGGGIPENPVGDNGKQIPNERTRRGRRGIDVVSWGLRRRQGTGRGSFAGGMSDAAEIEMQSLTANFVRGNVSDNGKVTGDCDVTAGGGEAERDGLLIRKDHQSDDVSSVQNSIGEESALDVGSDRVAIASEIAGRPGGVRRGGAGFVEQLGWLLWKRRVVAMRDWRGGLYQVVLPALLVGLVLLLLTIDVGLAGPPLEMSADMFDGPTQVSCVFGFLGWRCDGHVINLSWMKYNSLYSCIIAYIGYE